MTKKIKVGFYVQNEGYPNVDCRFPELGNPGLGGTQFSLGPPQDEQQRRHLPRMFSLIKNES